MTSQISKFTDIANQFFNKPSDAALLKSEKAPAESNSSDKQDALNGYWKQTLRLDNSHVREMLIERSSI